MVELVINLEDERAKALSGVLNNKVCKKIIELLSQEDLSEKDISKRLDVPINTLEYNIKKLVQSGLVEKSKSFFWSVKGRKIVLYKLSNKKIVISQKTPIVSSIVSLLSGGILLGLMRYFLNSRTQSIPENAVLAISKSSDIKTGLGSSAISNFTSYFIWVCAGMFLALIFFHIFKKLKGGSFFKWKNQ
jgi:DNA-binding transcriptional ArsR family regulator